MDSILFFETVGDLYYKRFMRLRPGKSEPYATGRDANSEENRSQFDEWISSGQAFIDSIEKIAALEKRLEGGE